MADLARHIHIRQEVHLDLDGAVTRARLTAAALDVEREPTGLVAADFRLGGGGEQGSEPVNELLHVVGKEAALERLKTAITAPR